MVSTRLSAAAAGVGASEGEGYTRSVGSTAGAATTGVGVGSGRARSRSPPRRKVRATARTATTARKACPSEIGDRRARLGVRLAFRRRLCVRGREVGDRLVDVEAQEEGVLLHEGAREEAAGQDVDPVLLEGLEEAQADLRPFRDVAQADAAQLAFSPQILAERAHGFRFLGPGQ